MRLRRKIQSHAFPPTTAILPVRTISAVRFMDSLTDIGRAVRSPTVAVRPPNCAHVRLVKRSLAVRITVRQDLCDGPLGGERMAASARRDHHDGDAERLQQHRGLSAQPTLGPTSCRDQANSHVVNFELYHGRWCSHNCVTPFFAKFCPAGAPR